MSVMAEVEQFSLLLVSVNVTALRTLMMCAIPFAEQLQRKSHTPQMEKFRFMIQFSRLPNMSKRKSFSC